jgi:hypothetical protein
MMDGSRRVNWLHIQALHHVISMHVVDFRDDEELEYDGFPMSLSYTQIIIPKGVDLDQEKDWAGVRGPWRVSFCFCDHQELLSALSSWFLFKIYRTKPVLSFQPTMNPLYAWTRLGYRSLCSWISLSQLSGPLDTSMFEDYFREVFSSLDVELYVTQTCADPDHPTRPRIYFFGEMADPSTSTLNGWVQMTPDDHVQWHFVSSALFASYSFF